MKNEELRKLVERDEIEKALKVLTIGIDSKKRIFFDEALMLSARMSSLNAQYRKGIISNMEFHRARMKITNSLLQIIDEVDSDDVSKAYKEKLRSSKLLTRVSSLFTLIAVTIGILGVVVDFTGFISIFNRSNKTVNQLSQVGRTALEQKINSIFLDLDSTFYINNEITYNETTLKNSMVILSGKTEFLEQKIRFSGYLIFSDSSNHYSDLYQLKGILVNDTILDSLKINSASADDSKWILVPIGN